MDNKYYCAVLKINDKIYILCDDDGSILLETTSEKMDHHFSDRYEEKHKLSYEWSMPACYHWILYQPRIQKAPLTIEEMKELEIIENAENIPLFTKGNQLFMKGIFLNGKNAENWYKDGTLVTLIN